MEDVFGLLVIISVLFALYRRYVINPKRLRGDGHTNADATLILLLILGVMISMFGINSVKSLIYPEHAEYYKWNFIASKLTPLFNKSSAVYYYYFFWWAHIVIILTFMNYLPYSKHFHIVTSLPNVYLSKTGPQTLDTEEIDFDKENVFL